MRADLLIHEIDHLYTLAPDAHPQAEGPLGLLRDASAAFKDGEVVYVGPSAHAPDAREVQFATGCTALPGLVDCHTHAVWAGSRADEFAQRLAGAAYSDILEAGGGILSTVRATRDASTAALAELCRARLRNMRRRGVTTVEVKGGYGLTPTDEARLLQAARAASDVVGVVTTFLGAHTIPAEWRHDRAAYVDQVVGPQLAAAAPFADFIDVYCDRGAFTLDESMRILQAGKDRGLAVRAHAEQVEHTGIAAAAAAMGATCVDHLERLDDAGIAALAEHGTVAVMLPGAQLYLRDSAPPVAALRAAGVPLAVATDLNPGSSPVHDLWTCATLSTVIQGLTIPEAVAGITRNAGRALGRPRLGWLGTGSAADLALFAPPPGEPPGVEPLVQHLAGHHAIAVVRDGVQVI